MNVYKQTCWFVSNATLHAKAKHNGNAWKLVVICTDYILSALWIIHKCLEVNVRCTMKLDDKIFFSYQFSQFPLESVWLALFCLGNDVNTVLRLLLGSTKHYRSYINNGFYLFHLTTGFFFGSIFYRLYYCRVLTCICTQ